MSANKCCQNERQLSVIDLTARTSREKWAESRSSLREMECKSGSWRVICSENAMQSGRDGGVCTSWRRQLSVRAGTTRRRRAAESLNAKRDATSRSTSVKSCLATLAAAGRVSSDDVQVHPSLEAWTPHHRRRGGVAPCRGASPSTANGEVRTPGGRATVLRRYGSFLWSLSWNELVLHYL